MRLKKFNEYSKNYSKDPKIFEKMVLFSERVEVDLFDKFGESPDSIEKPVIIWNSNLKINENSSRIYNSTPFPAKEKIFDFVEDLGLIPKKVNDRTLIKKMKFPIIGFSNSSQDEFKTYGKFKKSEKYYDFFREKITPSNRFEVIAYKENPIHIQEKINKLGFDVNLNRFKYLDVIEESLNSLNNKFNLDFYKIKLIESNNKIYLESIDSSGSLSPSQLVKMYETAYESYYEARLPQWFKKSIFEKYVSPYYKKRYYDSLLVKPKHSIDFKKFIS